MKRGEIWIANLEPGFGREIHKKRPAVILSKNSIHANSNHVIIIPASSLVPKIIGIEMILIGKKEGLDKPSVLLPVFIRSIDQKRLIKKVGKLSKAKLQEVEEAVKIILSLRREE